LGARFNEDGLAGLDDRPHSYRWKKRPQQQVVPDEPAIDGRASQ
jgi:hypothetical protein